MSHQHKGQSTEKHWSPNMGDRDNRGDSTGETLSSDAEGRADDRAAGARTTSKTPQASSNCGRLVPLRGPAGQVARVSYVRRLCARLVPHTSRHI
eukprot:scaffold141112_cov31-Tisochrysis_lutea.AAC.5